MDSTQLQEIKGLIELALKQTDIDVLSSILRNIFKKSKKYGLYKDAVLKKELQTLQGAVRVEQVFMSLSKLQGLVTKKISLVQANVVEASYYPAGITANKVVLKKMGDFIKNPRVAEKLRYLLDNLGNKSFLRQHSKGYSGWQGKIDMFCLNMIVTSGLAIRILYFIDQGTFRFCDFFIDHDKYQEAINKKEHLYLRKNYANERWLPVPRF